MPTDHRAKLATIRRFDQLVAYLRDEMGWPIARDSFEDVDDLFYDFTADELGIDPKTAAKIQSIKRLRPLSPRQPWGIFFVKFEPRKLPVVALRRILSQVALKKRASANSAERTAWAADDLLFVSNYGEGDERQISFAHFSKAADGHDLPTLKVLGWDNLDTALHLDAVAKELTQHLAWPDNDADVEAWRQRWGAAFTLRHREVVTTSKELSIRLAELARAIRDRIKTALTIETERGPLTKLMKAFKEALVHDLDAGGFADMYAQTIAYGLLSARIADPLKKTADDFAGHMRTNPFLKELMETFLTIGGRRGKAGGPGIDFDELGVSEVVELLDDTNMEAVVRDFGDRNPQEDPVIHFYELFLKEYDAKKRMQRGVFYTPRPVVSYIVRSVDELLRTEFGLDDGLADTTTWGEMAQRHKDLKIPEGTRPEQTFVQILDPATGTGTFLVEVIDLIYRTLVAKWKAQGHGEKKIEPLWNEYVPKHLLPRLHAYELLMAPYAIAHLKIGLKLYETGYRFGSDERARIYLTNALEPAHDFSGRFEFAIPALAHEAQAVNEIKRKQRFTVVIGNPPYSGTSANRGEWIQTSVRKYYTIDGEPLDERNPKWLLDDYVKFMRLDEMAIESSGVGIVGVITNHGFLANPTFRGLRYSLLETFNRIDVLDLHGNQKRREESPTGVPDDNVFDIQQGVGISLLRRTPDRNGGSTPQSSSVNHSELWGARALKYQVLSRATASTVHARPLSLRSGFWLLVPQDQATLAEYERFVSLTDLFVVHGVGMTTARDHVVIDFDTAPLLERIVSAQRFSGTDSEFCSFLDIPEKKGWDIGRTRQRLRAERHLEQHLTAVAYRPFDNRIIFYDDSLVWRTVKQVMRHMLAGRNIALVSARSNKSSSMDHFFCTRLIMETKYGEATTQSCLFPLFTFPDDDGLRLNSGPQPNFESNLLRSWKKRLSADGGEEPNPEALLAYLYGVCYSETYRSRYAEFLKIDFPRLPLTDNVELFRNLARAGAELVALHVMESPSLQRFSTTYTGPKNPEVGRVGWSDDTVWLNAPATKRGQSATPGTIGFRGVPKSVWNFHIGGYQVCEKWLKDRKGRTLSKDDIAHYQKIVVALNETIRLMREIDVVIGQHGGWPGAFQTGEAKAAAPQVIPFRPLIVQPDPKERYVTCLPLVPLKAAAGAFGDPQHIEDDGFEWVAVETKHRLRSGMFVARVVGKSMEPAIPDGAWCLFAAPVEGTRQGKTVLVQLRDATDPETGERYTVKRYESEKAKHADSWRHTRIALKPVNPDFEPIVLTGDEGELQVVAELVELLGGKA